MATPKIWTATDVSQKQLRLERIGSEITAHRDFVFVDALGQPLTTLGLQMFQTTAAVSTIPPNILTALQTIDTWLYAQILAQEGMT
jgi:hypothetical protein